MVKAQMNEFSLINHYFQSISPHRPDVIFGIGDDAACLSIPQGSELLVSSDTLVADVHFCQSWDAYAIARKAVAVNVSDIAAMAGTPTWLTLALTLPDYDESWLQRFSQGLQDSLHQYDIALIGGDTTRGPLSMTLTIHGLVPKGQALRRSGAKPGDHIYVSGELGAAALAVQASVHGPNELDMNILLKALKFPTARVDLRDYLNTYATAAIDISDGLSADLNHICVASQVGACLDAQSIPIHPLVAHYLGEAAVDFALSGGDDYELCFTVASEHETVLLSSLLKAGLTVYRIGVIQAETGLRIKGLDEVVRPLRATGYQHF